MCVHMHTGMSTFTHRTLHTHRAVCAGRAVSEHTRRAHVHTPKPHVHIKAPPWFLRYKLCFTNSQAYISVSVFLLGSSFPGFFF